MAKKGESKKKATKKTATKSKKKQATIMKQNVHFIIFLFIVFFAVSSANYSYAQQASTNSSNITSNINRLDNEIKYLKEEVNLKINSTIRWANSLLTVSSIFIGIITLILLVLGAVYWFKFREIENEATKSVEEIKSIVEEGKRVISLQRQIFRDFEEEALQLFDEASIPEHVIPEVIVSLTDTPAPKLSDEQEERIKDIITCALSYKTISLKENKNLAKVFIRIGNYYRLTNDFVKAKIYYEYALKIDENNYIAYNSIGAVFIELKKYREAMKYFDKSIELNNKYWAPYNNEGWIYDEWEEYDKAIKEYNKAKELTSSDKSLQLVHYNCACAYAKKGDYKNTYLHLKKAIGIWPENKRYALQDPDFRKLFGDKKYGEKAQQLCKT